MAETTTVDGGWRGEITGTVTERDWLGTPTRVKETWTGQEYTPDWTGTFRPSSSDSSDSGSGSDGKSK